MSQAGIPLCKCGCGRPVPARQQRGRPAEYACDACRVRAFRQRRTVAAALQELDDRPAPAASAEQVQPVPTDEQVARALLEVRGLAGTFLRMGREARPQFAWRSECLGKAVASAIDEYFDGIF